MKLTRDDPRTPAIRPWWLGPYRIAGHDPVIPLRSKDPAGLAAAAAARGAGEGLEDDEERGDAGDRHQERRNEQETPEPGVSGPRWRGKRLRRATGRDL